MNEFVEDMLCSLANRISDEGLARFPDVGRSFRYEEFVENGFKKIEDALFDIAMKDDE